MSPGNAGATAGRSRKLHDATLMLSECVGRHGVWAAPDRYRWQCWTRDFCLAVAPLLMQLGMHGTALAHLMSLAYRQRADGSIPILFLDGLRGHARFLADKLQQSARQRKVSFMLRRYAELRGDVGDLTPGTRDSEVNFAVAALELLRSQEARAAASGEEADRLQAAAERALDYVAANLLSEDGRIEACDWRDTMHLELGRAKLLSNNAILVRAYDLSGAKAKANALRGRINALYWQRDGVGARTLLDFPETRGRQAIDPLGASLAVLNEVVGPDAYEDVAASIDRVSTPFGPTIQCRHSAFSEGERAVIERTDGVVVWPFVSGFTVLALARMADGSAGQERNWYRHMARRELDKMARLDGFAEWYDPADGRPYGAPRQLWSAALYARAFAAVHG